MRNTVVSASLLWLAVTAGSGVEANQDVVPATVERSAQYTLKSATVDDEFVVQVRLPASYAAGDKKYPVLYVLDGDKCFGLAADTVEWLAWANEAPELIVVGIGYGPGRDWWQKRSRDLTPTRDSSKLWGDWPLAGGAGAFQAFLERELFPLIESRYRALADDRGVAGISFGGLFAAYSLFTRPALFRRYVLIAPAFVWDNKRLWSYEAEYFGISKGLPATVFTAIGRDDEANIVQPWREFNRLVRKRGYSGLRWLTQEYADEGHISVLPGALSRGVRLVYGK